MFNKETIKRALFLSTVVFVVSAGIALVLAELLIKYVHPQMTLTQARKVSLRVFSKSDFLPYELIPNLKTNHIGHTFEFDYKINTSKLGLRESEMSLEKDSSVFRILMLGDSITFGWGVEDNQTFSAILQKLLNQDLEQTVDIKRVEVINAGFADGYSPDTYYLYLKNKGLKLQPDLVIMNFFVRNDVSDLFENEWKQKDEKGLPTEIISKYRVLSDGYFSYKDGDWKFKVPIANDSHLGILFLTVLDTKAPKVANFIKYSLLNSPKTSNRITDGEVVDCIYNQKCSQAFEEKFEKVQFVLKEIGSLAREQGVSTLITLVPDPYQLERVRNAVKEQDQYAFIDDSYDVRLDGSLILEEAEPQKRLRLLLEKEGLFYFDLLPYLVTKKSESYFFREDGHYRVEGNEKIAQAYFDFLIGDQKSGFLKQLELLD